MPEEKYMARDNGMMELGVLLYGVGCFRQFSGMALDEPSLLDALSLKEEAGGALHGAEFIKNHHDIFPQGINIKVLQNWLTYSTEPENHFFQHIVKSASAISLGMDDRELDTLKQGETPLPLLSIFSTIDIGIHRDKTEKSCKSYQPGVFLPGEKNLMPQKGHSLSKETRKEHWENFVADFKTLKDVNPDFFIQTLISLLLKYTWSVPFLNPGEKQSDISLYDYLATTTAFASALFGYHQEKETLTDIQAINNEKDKKFLFVSGDLSGIQKYIFGLKTSKFSSKLLRARSYELVLLSNYFIRKILGDLQLSSFCSLSNAGGRFLLVLPHTEKNREYIKNLSFKIEEHFVREYYGEISLNLSTGRAFSKKDLKKENIAAFHAGIQEDVNKAKKRKFRHYLAGSTDNHVMERDYNKIKSAQDICSFCGKRYGQSDGDERICSFCKNHITLGTNLPKAKFFSYTPDEKAGSHRSFILPDKDRIVFTGKNESLPENAPSWSVNKYKDGFPVLFAPFYLPHEENGTPFTFSELAEKARGNQKIAMFKADVDNLGLIFSKGLGNNKSISRYASLSRMMDLFFSGFLNNLIEKEFRNIYTVFSGGDDVCVIGPWNEIIDFSIRFNTLFREYTALNPDISLSAGIALASPHLPMNSLAVSAEDLLEKAKGRRDKNGKIVKNAVSLFDTSLAWKDLESCVGIANELREKTEQEIFSTRLVYSLLYYIKRKEACNAGSVEKNNILWRSHLKYSVARNIRDQEEREWFLDMVENNIDTGLKVIVNHALYQLRGDIHVK